MQSWYFQDFSKIFLSFLVDGFFCFKAFSSWGLGRDFRRVSPPIAPSAHTGEALSVVGDHREFESLNGYFGKKKTQEHRGFTVLSGTIVVFPTVSLQFLSMKLVFVLFPKQLQLMGFSIHAKNRNLFHHDFVAGLSLSPV